MRRTPLRTAQLTFHMFALGIVMVCLALWIYDTAHGTQPQYSNPNYPIELESTY